MKEIDCVWLPPPIEKKQKKKEKDGVIYEQHIERVHCLSPWLPHPSSGQTGVVCHMPAPVTESVTQEKLRLLKHWPQQQWSAGYWHSMAPLGPAHRWPGVGRWSGHSGEVLKSSYHSKIVENGLWPKFDFSTWKARQLLRSNWEESIHSSRLLKVSNGHPLVPWCRVILKHLAYQGISNIIGYVIHKTPVLSSVNSWLNGVDESIVRCSNHLRWGSQVKVPTTNQPKLAPNNRSFAALHRSWKRGKWRPRWCPREKCQYRREKDIIPIISSSDNKCLWVFKAL